MKPSSPLYILWLLALCAGVVACTDREAMQERLAYVSACNRADTVFTARWVPTVDSLVEFFDGHGSPNDRMMAHYLQGRVHHDMGEAPRAVDCYQEAVDCADTTQTDCDFKQLARVHCQTAELFYQQLLPNEMLEELEQARKHALLGHDTITALIAYERRSSAYSLLNQQDSATSIIEKTYQLYLNYGYDDLAANAASTLFVYLVEQKNWEKAKVFMDIYEQQSVTIRKPHTKGFTTCTKQWESPIPWLNMLICVTQQVKNNTSNPLPRNCDTCRPSTTIPASRR
jgi:tetratricopeptide (TPR) repeat protein